MKNLKVSFSLLIVMSLCFLKAHSQISLSTYTSSNSKFGVAYNFNNKLWSELRINSTISLNYFTPDLVVCYNVLHQDTRNVYIGLGANVNYRRGIMMPVGVQFAPFGKVNSFSVHIECSPVYRREDNFVLQTSWGVRYMFSKKKF